MVFVLTKNEWQWSRMLRCGSCSVCDLVRLAVRPVNSHFDIFIRNLFYLNNKRREDARKLSWLWHGHVNTKATTGSSESWSIFFFSFFRTVRAQTTVTTPTLRALFEINLCLILKPNTPLQRPCNQLNEDGLLERIQREMTPWWSFEISRRFAAHRAESLAANRWSLSITKNAPYAWGNFHACAITRFQKPQQLSWAGRGQRARRSPCAQRAETRSQQPALLQTAAETTAACWWINWQRRLESWSSSSSLQRGWSARMATRWSSHHPACSIRYPSLHVSTSANDSFKKFTGARSRWPHHSHFSHGRQNRRSSFCRCRTVREAVRIWWQSRGLQSLCLPICTTTFML